MRNLVWIVIVSAVLASCAVPAPTSAPVPISTPTWTPAPTSTLPPPTRTAAPTLTPTVAPTGTPVATATPAAIQPSTATLPLSLTVDDLVGIWQQEGLRDYVEFKRDGTWGLADGPQYLKAGRYDYEGKWSIEGGMLTLTDTAFCPDDIGVYRLESRAEGKLGFALVQDECKAPQTSIFNFQRWEWFAGLLLWVP